MKRSARIRVLLNRPRENPRVERRSHGTVTNLRARTVPLARRWRRRVDSALVLFDVETGSEAARLPGFGLPRESGTSPADSPVAQATRNAEGEQRGAGGFGNGGERNQHRHDAGVERLLPVILIVAAVDRRAVHRAVDVDDHVPSGQVRREDRPGPGATAQDQAQASEATRVQDSTERRANRDLPGDSLLDRISDDSGERPP